ncbi:MAG: hypothetical protein JW878_09675 [Methanomicrobia archaeon]|nr:hypothetical protein [Methanomicrobia archaeon]
MSYTGDAAARSGDITLLTGFNPCEAVEAPIMTPLGAFALLALLSTIAAVTIARKRR